MSGALENIRVVDLSRVLAGPLCTQILGDMGADIIKIERPGHGDDTRNWGPPFLEDTDGNETSESAYYLSANRNKRSLTVDITTSEGQDIIHSLLEGADILIQNFKVGGLDKYNLGYAAIKKKHPHIVYCAITGFGQTGPLAKEPGYDFLAQAMGGLMACTGEPDGPPMKAGVALSDVMTGLYGAIGILSALHHREKTGKGQLVDTALLDCTLAGMVNIAQYYLTSGETAPRLGNAHSTIVPYQAFETGDGHVIIAIGNNEQFQRLCRFIGHEDWATDEKFATNQARVRHRDALIPKLAAVIAQKSTDFWVNGLHEAGVPVGPVNDMEQTFAMDQIQARDMKIEMNHTTANKQISLVGNPLKFSETPTTYHRPPPVCGEHTDEVLKTVLNMSETDIKNLRDRKII